MPPVHIYVHIKIA